MCKWVLTVVLGNFCGPNKLEAHYIQIKFGRIQAIMYEQVVWGHHQQKGKITWDIIVSYRNLFLEDLYKTMHCCSKCTEVNQGHAIALYINNYSVSLQHIDKWPIDLLTNIHEYVCRSQIAPIRSTAVQYGLQSETSNHKISCILLLSDSPYTLYIDTCFLLCCSYTVQECNIPQMTCGQQQCQPLDSRSTLHTLVLYTVLYARYKFTSLDKLQVLYKRL